MVTGGAGFIGSHICDRLIGMGIKVVCVDNLFSGFEKNIAHLIDDENFKFIDTYCDLMNQRETRRSDNVYKKEDFENFVQEWD